MDEFFDLNDVDLRELRIVKSNPLINGAHRLGLGELRLINLCIGIAQFRKINLENSEPVRIQAKDYMNAFNVDKNTAYAVLKSAVLKLFHREFAYVNIDQAKVRARWVSSIAYKYGEGYVELVFSPQLVPFISYQKMGNFTQYNLENIALLKSKYSFSLYELLISNIYKTDTHKISLKDLRDRMCVSENEYKTMSTFKKILKRAVSDINEKTDIEVKFEQYKRGRNIVGFSFHFHKKEQKNSLPSPKEMSDLQGIWASLPRAVAECISALKEDKNYKNRPFNDLVLDDRFYNELKAYIIKTKDEWNYKQFGDGITPAHRENSYKQAIVNKSEIQSFLIQEVKRVDRTGTYNRRNAAAEENEKLFIMKQITLRNEWQKLDYEQKERFVKQVERKIENDKNKMELFKEKLDDTMRDTPNVAFLDDFMQVMGI